MVRRPLPFGPLAAALMIVLTCWSAAAQDATGSSDAETLAKQLANPVASLITVPFQNNWDFGYGPDDVNATFLQPFVNYTTKNATGFEFDTESTYDWESEEWSVPLNAGITQVFEIGSQRVQIGVFGRWWAETPEGGPDWGLRFPVTLLFPG